jgi:D-alanine-D-alanine ligase
VVHGWGGEDGRYQGLLDVAGVPYVGAGVSGSAVAMDKAIARTLAEAAGVPVAEWALVRERDWRSDPASVIARLVERPGVPAFVKPANAGSSVGISKVAVPGELETAIDRALAFDRRVVVERAVDAREIEVAVLGNDLPEASVAGEIVPGAEFYSYEDKYVDGKAALRIPAPLEPEVAEIVRRRAVEAYRALDLLGLARVDFFLDRATGGVLFNEANSLPGFTPISMYAKLWEASGVPYDRLLTRLVELALERPGARPPGA